MKDTTWYRLLRLILGVGVFVALLGGIVAVEGTAAVAEDLNEPMSTADILQFMVGIINPPLFNTPEPRSIFQ